MPSRRAVLAFLLTVLCAVGSARAAEWRPDPGRSIFAVLTRPAGPAARLAHPHLVVSRGPRIELAFDETAPESTRFALVVPVLALDADPATERAELAPRLAELGAWDGELAPVDDGDRKKIRTAMLGPDQLFAERHPEVRAELLAVERRGSGDGGGARVALGWNARVRIEVRGAAIERTFPLRWEIEGDTLTAEVLAEAKFSDFDIEPYSTMLGAIRNADLFHLYVRLIAKRSD